MKNDSLNFFRPIKNTKKYISGLITLLIFVALIRTIGNLQESLHFGKIKPSYLHSTVGWVDKVEFLGQNEQKITYSYFVSNQNYKNSQTITEQRDIKVKDLVKISHCVKKPSDSCIAAQMPNTRVLFYWLFLLGLTLSVAIILFQFLIDLHKIFYF